MAVVVWFRSDLRLRDHEALAIAMKGGTAVVPVFVWSPQEEGDWPIGAASRWWLHHSLAALGKDLWERGSRLVLRMGHAAEELQAVAQEVDANRVVCGFRCEPAGREQERRVCDTLSAAGVELTRVNSGLMLHPEEVRTRGGGPYQVFTPFWREVTGRLEEFPLHSAPSSLPAPRKWPASARLADLGLLPDRNWADGFSAHWEPGEAGAKTRLRRFLQGPAEDYEAGRDRPGEGGTAGLSAHLHFGEISVRRAWNKAVRAGREAKAPGARAAVEAWRRQLVWREFAGHLLWHFPETADEPLRERFAAFPWSEDHAALEAWRRGRTGYPIVDAGMRQLWQTGWMHNRVRMIVASFLTKDLLVTWQEGARWFWDALVDADLANNTLGWQWTAGCGADAAPYFRVFNPVSQGRKFDPEGDYVRRWVPELAGLADRWLHAPWEAPAEVLADAGVRLGKDYPLPVVDHTAARRRALDAYGRLPASG